MSKRFTDTKIWDDPWFQDLPIIWKVLWKYLCDLCDEAGIWKVNKRQAEFQIGQKIQWEKMHGFLNNGKWRVIEFKEDVWLIKDFVAFQYGEKIFTSNHSFHQRILKTLEKYPIDTLSDTLLNRTKEKEQETDKVKEEVKVKEQKKPLWLINSEEGFAEYLKLAEPHFDALMQDPQWIYERKCLFPSCSVKRTILRMWKEYWGTKAGWENKRAYARGKSDYEPGWKSTIERNFKKSIVYFEKGEFDDEKALVDRWRSEHA